MPHMPSRPLSGPLPPLFSFYKAHILLLSFSPLPVLPPLTSPSSLSENKIKKMWHMFSYKNEWHPYEMDKSEITMLNEISQVQKENTMLSSHIRGQTSH